MRKVSQVAILISVVIFTCSVITTNTNMYYNNQLIPWGQKRIGLDTEIRDIKIKVAILDSGIQKDHEDLKQKIVKTYNAIEPSTPVEDEYGHGTNIAGIITANDNEAGIVGISQNVEIYDIKVLDKDGRGQLDNVIDGMKWAADQNVDIINISFGFIKNYPELENQINFLLKKNIVVVASAGNNAGLQSDYPARYKNVISVGSMVQDGSIDVLSSRGKVEVYAPGKDIYTTHNDGEYKWVRGSSLSTAYVTGQLAKAISSGEIKDKKHNPFLVEDCFDYLRKKNNLTVKVKESP
ncbi:S8 family serine peptidase [Bacillus sp. RO3]|nr:S8 family serine peptidase [Bacillus sp. RO3]